jgi:hypothetical protein
VGKSVGGLGLKPMVGATVGPDGAEEVLGAGLTVGGAGASVFSSSVVGAGLTVS